MGVVHQEQRNPVVVVQVASGDVLPIAAEVGETQRVLVKRTQEPHRTATVLNVWPAGLTDGGYVEAVAQADEQPLVGPDPIGNSGALDHPSVGPVAPVSLLVMLDLLSEGDLRVSAGHFVSL